MQLGCPCSMCNDGTGLSCSLQQPNPCNTPLQYANEHACGGMRLMCCTDTCTLKGNDLDLLCVLWALRQHFATYDSGCKEGGGAPVDNFEAGNPCRRACYSHEAAAANSRN